MTSLSLAPVQVPEFDGPHAVVAVEDIATENDQGFLASLIYLEGDYAIYLDEEDSDLALNDTSDRDLAIMEGLLDLAVARVSKERRIRARASSEAETAW